MFPERVRNVVRGSMGPDFSVWNENERKYNEEEASLSKEAPSSFFLPDWHPYNLIHQADFINV